MFLSSNLQGPFIHTASFHLDHSLLPSLFFFAFFFQPHPSVTHTERKYIHTLVALLFTFWFKEKPLCDHFLSVYSAFLKYSHPFTPSYDTITTNADLWLCLDLKHSLKFQNVWEEMFKSHLTTSVCHTSFFKSISLFVFHFSVRHIKTLQKAEGCFVLTWEKWRKN